MAYNCSFCGKSSDEVAIYHDWPHDALGDVSFCWDCYHKEVIKQEKEAFSLHQCGENGGWIDRHTLRDAIYEALIETEENIDQAIGIESSLSNGYMSSLIVRNGNLYLRVSDLRFLREIQTQEIMLRGIEEAIAKLSWVVEAPISIDDSNI